MRDLLFSAGLQSRVIKALLIREMYTRFGRSNLGFLWVVGEPMLFCGCVAIMWYAIRGSSEHAISVIAFAITGYNPLTLWRHCVYRGVKAFESNGSLLFHRQVTPLDIISARLILEVLGSTAAFVLTGLVAIMLGVTDPPHNYGLLYAGWLYAILYSVASGLILAGISEMSEFLERIIGVVTYISLPFSGAFTMVDWVPQKFQKVLLYSPSVNAFEMIRGGWFGPSIHAKFDPVYTSWTCGLMLLGGLYAVKAARKHILVM